MKSIFNVLILSFSLILSMNIYAKKFDNFVLQGENGGKVDGTNFDTKSTAGKITNIFYVDPDFKDLNEELTEKLKKESFNNKYFHSFGIINMKATWLPNFLLTQALKQKQKKYPNATYVKDFTKTFVGKWGLNDDAYNYIILDEDQNILFRKAGKLDGKDIQKVIKMIEMNIQRLKAKKK